MKILSKRLESMVYFWINLFSYTNRQSKVKISLGIFFDFVYFWTMDSNIGLTDTVPFPTKPSFDSY